jgi:peptide deformylase
MAEIEGEVKEEQLDPEREARRRVALAQIRQYPDAALKIAARPVAATQVGVLQRLFVFQLSEDEMAAIANPEIVERSEETAVEDEGCLSIQGVLLPVERNATVTVTGRDEQGAEARFELEEPLSRVVQHEIDHLDGVLILDRTTPEARREALSSLRPRIVLG